MKYLCLLYSERQKLEALPKSEFDAIVREYLAFTNGIKKSGHYLAGEALHPVRTAKTLRIRNGKLSATDGPFAETKEQLGGFYLIDAKNLDDAIQVASKIPAGRWGSVSKAGHRNRGPRAACRSEDLSERLSDDDLAAERER